MAYINGVFPDYNGLPRIIPRNEAFTLQLNVFLDDGSTKDTLSAATLTLKNGTEVVVDAQSATVGGSVSASYAISAASTKDLNLSDMMLELWTITTSTGVTTTIRRSGMLVRHQLYPLVKDSDLIMRHNQLDDIRPTSISNWLDYIKTAWEVLNRDLIKRGKRPALILDSYALFDMHLFKALELIFRDMTTFVGDGRYHDLWETYRDSYTAEWDTVSFHYDSDQDGTIDADDKNSAVPSLWLGVPPGWPLSGLP